MTVLYPVETVLTLAVTVLYLVGELVAELDEVFQLPCPPLHHLAFRVSGSGFRAKGLGCRV